MRIGRLLSHVMALSAVTVVLGCGTQPPDDAAPEDPSDASSPTPPRLTEPPNKPSDETPPGKPIPVRPGDEFAPTVVWKHDELIVTAYGSGTCRPVATGAAVVEPQMLLISFQDPPEQACTDDYAPHQSRLPAPAGDVDLQRRVHAVLNLEGAPQWLIKVQLMRPTTQD